MIETDIILHATKVKSEYGSNARYICVVDMSRPAKEPRLFVVDTKENEIRYSGFTSHGRGSGGIFKALQFSNVPNSNNTSLGVYKTAEVYYSEKFQGKSLRLDGLDDSNSNARKRAIVMHPAWYVSQDFIKTNGYPGRSEGCITLDPVVSDWVINLLMGGSLISVINNS